AQRYSSPAIAEIRHRPSAARVAVAAVLGHSAIAPPKNIDVLCALSAEIKKAAEAAFLMMRRDYSGSS
ncbi:MAG: hypothetical protein ACOVN8_07375, partial [Burkholderiaceae bacterium]